MGTGSTLNYTELCVGGAQQDAVPSTDATPQEGPSVLPGVQQWLQVCALKPHMHVSLVDTDLEAEVTPSAEFMERVAAEQVPVLPAIS